MNVTLPATWEEFIRHKVAAGLFASPDDVLCEGLRLLQREEEWSASARAKIDTGWRQAKSGQLRTPAQVQENLAFRRQVWKQSQAAGE